MTFNQIEFGGVFYIDGAPYQCFKKHGRLITAIELDRVTMAHVPDAQDISGIGLRTTLFSDMRINANNATLLECEAYMQELKAMNHG